MRVCRQIHSISHTVLGFCRVAAVAGCLGDVTFISPARPNPTVVLYRQSRPEANLHHMSACRSRIRHLSRDLLAGAAQLSLGSSSPGDPCGRGGRFYALVKHCAGPRTELVRALLACITQLSALALTAGRVHHSSLSGGCAIDEHTQVKVCFAVVLQCLTCPQFHSMLLHTLHARSADLVVL